MECSMNCNLVFVRTTIAIGILSLLAGCANFRPEGTSIALSVPAKYRSTSSSTDNAVTTDIAQDFQVGAQPVPQWWTLYQSEILNALVDEGLRNSPNLAAAERNLAAAREQLRAQIGSSTLPSIDVGIQAGRQRELGIPIPGAGTDTMLFNTFAGQLQASYTIDLFGAARFANSSLSHQVAAESFQVDAVRRTLAANIVTAAITASSLQAQLNANERLVVLAKEEASDAKRRYALGAGSYSDMLEVQQTADTLQSSLPTQRQQLTVVCNALAVLIGRMPDQAPATPTFADIHLPRQIPVMVPSALLRTRPDVRATEALLEAASFEFGVATARLFPQLTLSAGLGRGGLSWSMLTSSAGDIWGMGASLTQPLFHGGALRAQRRAAQASYEAAAERYKHTVLTAFQDVADTLAALEHDAQSLNALRRAAAAASDRAHQALARVRLGAVPLSIARASEQQLRKAQADEIGAKATWLTDTARLFHAMGTQPAADEQISQR